MDQEDYLLREIEKIGVLLKMIFDKIAGKEGTHALSVKNQFAEEKGLLLDDTGFDIDLLLSLETSEIEKYLFGFNVISGSNIELLADILKEMGMEPGIVRNKEYLTRAAQLYEYRNSSDKTFSFERERKINEIKMMIQQLKIQVLQGDITKMEVDAIVNAANSSLMGGGGVDGAIHKAGGTVILEECKNIIANQGRCETGNAVITTAGKLPAKFVIHTVGPVWCGGDQNEAKLLENVYRNSLELAVENKIATIAFPNISTGIYSFPKKQAAEIAIKTVSDFLLQTDKIKSVYFVCFDSENFSIYIKQLHN
jgi:O-acetyl-ADP-ribose deacetylase